MRLKTVLPMKYSEMNFSAGGVPPCRASHSQCRLVLVRVWLLFVVLFCTPITLKAQIPDSGVTAKTLDNGVRLLLKPETETPLVSLTALVKISPARNEQEAATAEIVARAMHNGTASQPTQTKLRGSFKWEIIKTDSVMGVSAVFLPNQLGEILYQLSDALRNAEFAPQALELARQEVLQSRREKSKEPFAALKSVIIGNFAPFAEPDEYSLKCVTPEQAQAYFQANVAPQNVVIAIVGSANADRMVSLAKTQFDNMKSFPASRNARVGNAVSEKRDPRANLTPKLPKGRAAYALVATSAPPVTHPDYPAFVVMQTVLGTGHGSRLFQRIREDKGIGYSVGTYFGERDSEPLVTYLQWDSTREFLGKDERLTPLQMLNAEIDLIVSEPPADAEIQRARSVAIGKHALRHERAINRAFALAWYEILGLGWQFDTLLAEKLAAVTRDEILRVAKIYLPKRVTLLATPR